jgi:serine/threonine protein kinase
MQDISGTNNSYTILQCDDTQFDASYEAVKAMTPGGQGTVALSRDKNANMYVVVKTVKVAQGMDVDSIDEVRMLKLIRQLSPHDNIAPFLEIYWTPAPSAASTSADAVAGAEVWGVELPAAPMVWHSRMSKNIVMQDETPNPSTSTCRIVLPNLSGGDLTALYENFAKSETKIPEALIWHIYKSMVAGIAFLHENGISHRDIKPHNVMLDPVHFTDPKLFPDVKIIDFGLATTQTADHPCLAGTVRWQPPQNTIAGAKADVWAIGATIHFLATGTSPAPDMPETIPQREARDFLGMFEYTVQRIVHKENANFDTDMTSLEKCRNITLHSTNYPLPRLGYSILLEHYMCRALDKSAETRITLPSLITPLSQDADTIITKYQVWYVDCRNTGSQRPRMTYVVSEPSLSWTPTNNV